MNKLVERAQNKYTMSRPNNEAFDPAILWVIADIVEQVMSMLAVCRDANGAFAILNNPTLLQRTQLGLRVRRTMGLRGFRQNNGDEVIKSLLDAGKECKLEEVKEAMEMA